MVITIVLDCMWTYSATLWGLEVRSAISMYIDSSVYWSLVSCLDYSKYKDEVLSIFRKEAMTLPKDQNNDVYVNKDNAIALATYMINASEELALDYAECDSYVEFHNKFGFKPRMSIFIYLLAPDKIGNFDQNYLLILEEIGKCTSSRDIYNPLLFVESNSAFH
jgi:hypothetical protein